MSTTDERYPYTYAALYISENLAPGRGERIAQSGTGEAHFESTGMSISEADALLTNFCRALNLDIRESAIRLAKLYLREHAETNAR